MEIFNAEEQREINQLTVDKPKSQTAQANRRLKGPVKEPLPPERTRNLQELKDEIRLNENQYKAMKKKLERAEEDLELVQQAALYEAVREPRSINQRSKSSEILGKWGHPSEETLCLADVGILRGAEQPIRGKSIPTKPGPRKLRPPVQYPTMQDFVPIRYFRLRRRHRVTAEEQFAYLESMQAQSPQTVSQPSHPALLGRVPLPCDKRAAMRKKEVEKIPLATNIAHQYKRDELETILGELKPERIEELLLGRRKQAARRDRIVQEMMPKSAVSISSQVLSEMKSHHKDFSADPLYDKPPDQYRHKMDELIKWKEAEILRDRVLKEGDQRAEEQKEVRPEY